MVEKKKALKTALWSGALIGVLVYLISVGYLYFIASSSFKFLMDYMPLPAIVAAIVSFIVGYFGMTRK